MQDEEPATPAKRDKERKSPAAKVRRRRPSCRGQLPAPSAVGRAVTKVTVVAACQRFLADVARCRDPLLLLRGEAGVSLTYELRRCPTARRPLHTPPPLHLVADDWFFRTFGIRYRSNAVFCTTDREFAASFGDGNVRYIYPVGEYRICWSLSSRRHAVSRARSSHRGEASSSPEECWLYRVGSVRGSRERPRDQVLHCQAYYSCANPLC